MISLIRAGENLGRAVWGESRHRMVSGPFPGAAPTGSFGERGPYPCFQGESFPGKPLCPRKGSFLVATAGMQDPRFRRSVVLLLEHGENGTLGLIVNKVTEISLAQVLPRPGGLQAGSQTLLFFGGPVGLDGILFLTRNAEPPERAEHVMEDVYYSGDRNLLDGVPGAKQGRR